MPHPSCCQARALGLLLRRRTRRLLRATAPCALLCLWVWLSLSPDGVAARQTTDKTDRVVVMFKSKDCPDKDDFPGTTVNVGGVRAVSEERLGGWAFINVTPGDYMVSGLREPEYPNAKIVSVRVKLGQVLIREYDAGAAGTNIALEERLFFQTGASPVIEVITANDCSKAAAREETTTDDGLKKVDVFFKSLECDKRSFKGYTLFLNEQDVDPDQDDIATDVPVKNGKYRVRISAPDFPGAKVASVSVYTPGSVAYVRKDAGPGGEVQDLVLDGDLWEGATATSAPAVFVYTAGDCTSAYEPPTQRLGGPPQIKVVSVSGQVTVFRDDRPEAESQAVRGSMIEDQQVVYTRPGGRVELVASDKRLFILGGKTVVKFVIRKGPGGVWEMTADLRAAEEFNVRHVGYVKGAGGYEWKVLTPTASVTEKGTLYDVTYDEASGVTTVGVEQGQVTVTPTNTSLKPFTLDARQTADVSDSRVSAVSPLSDSDRRGGGGWLDDNLLLVGIGAVGFLGLLLLPLAIYIIYRVLRRPRLQTAFSPAGGNSAQPPRAYAPARDAAGGRRCPNPNCGHFARAGKKFCPACGTPLI